MKLPAVLLPVSILAVSACSNGLVKPGAEVRSALPPKTHTLAEAWSGAEGALLSIGQPMPLDVYAGEHRVSGSGIIVIEVRSHDFDAIAVVTDGEGRLVAFNDNWDGTRNARIVLDGAPDGGRLLVFSRDDSRGLYDVVVAQGTPEDLEEFAGASNLQAGEVRGWLGQNTRNPMMDNLLREPLENMVSNYNFSRAMLYPFTIEEPGLVSLSLESDAFDPYLVLMSVENGSFEFVEYNDDFAGTWSRIIREFAPGDYIAVVMPYSDSGFGEFTLKLETYGPEMFETNETEAPEQGVSYTGTVVPDRNLVIAWWPEILEDWNAPPFLTAFTPAAVFRFSTATPGIHRMEATGTADVCLTVFRDMDGQLQLVSFNDDHPDMGSNSSVAELLVPGDYVALVSLYSSTGIAEEVTFSWSPAGTSIQRLRAGSSVQVSAPYETESLFFQLDVTAGREYTLRVQSTDLDPVTTLFLPDGESLYSDDDGEGTNSLITFTPTAEQAGTCFIKVEKYSPAEGSFTVSVR